MLVSEFVPIKVVPRNKRRFLEWGFEDVSVGEVIQVPVDRLTECSTYKVQVQCDYCGCRYEIPIVLRNRNLRRSHITNDCCSDCKQHKAAEAIQSIYGVNSVMALPEIRAKREQTCLDRYGVANTSSLPEIRDKYKQTMIERYGNDNPMHVMEIREKRAATCQERYGAEFPLSTKEVQQKVRQTCKERYGSEYVTQNADVRARILETVRERYGCDNPMQNRDISQKSISHQSKVLVSRGQQGMFDNACELGYKCELNYPHNGFSYDVALFVDGYCIDLEYDGQYWHKDRQEYDTHRDRVSVESGWKVIRFQQIGRYLKPPTKEQIQAAVDAVIQQDLSVLHVELRDPSILGGN